jgi:3-oxoacyl-[acyl-carrier protein] reductase
VSKGVNRQLNALLGTGWIDADAFGGSKSGRAQSAAQKETQPRRAAVQTLMPATRAAVRMLRAAHQFARDALSLGQPASIRLVGDWESGTASIAGKIVLITGSTRGIGAAAARLFAQRGAIVAVHGRNATRAEDVAGQIRELGGKARGYGADLSRPGEATRLVRMVTGDFGGLDVLINNSAILPQHKQPPWKSGAAEFAEVMATNVIGPFEASVAAVAWMERNRRPGRIVNISSSVADLSRDPKLGLAAYAISKVALEGISCYLSHECQELGIVVATLRAPTADTDMIRTHIDAEMRPLLPRAEDAAQLYLWVATAPTDEVSGRVRIPPPR